MKWWWNISARARTILSAVFVLLILVAIIVAFLLFINWLLPKLFTAAIVIVVVIACIAVFCFAINF